MGDSALKSYSMIDLSIPVAHIILDYDGLYLTLKILSIFHSNL